MKPSKLFQPTRSMRKPAALLLGSVGVLLFATLLFAKGVEPGPEADGQWSCDKVVFTEKPSRGVTYTRVGTLELRGRTYRTAAKGDSLESHEFIPFTADTEGEIKWRDSFVWISSVGAINKSVYFVRADKVPSIDIEFSDNHAAGHMTCHKNP